jgi:hypothetical protein
MKPSLKITNDEFEDDQDDDIIQGMQICNMTTFYNPSPGKTTEIAMSACVFNPAVNLPTYFFMTVTQIQKNMKTLKTV